MVIDKDEFVADLVRRCPSASAIVEEHLAAQDGELLLHLLVADLRRFVLERFEAADMTVLNHCLDSLALGLTDGDDYVTNAIAVSFVEDTGWWDPAVAPFVAAWPLPLQREACRQRQA